MLEAEKFSIPTSAVVVRSTLSNFEVNTPELSPPNGNASTCIVYKNASLLLQAAVDCAVNPPKPGDESYESFIGEKTKILRTLEENSNLIVSALQALPGIKCAPIQGAMYVYPEVRTAVAVAGEEQQSK